MRVHIIDSVMGLGLNRKIVGVLRLVSFDGETVTMSQLIRVLHVMEYEDWERFDNNIDSVIVKPTNTVKPDKVITISGPSDVSDYSKKNASGDDVSELIGNQDNDTDLTEHTDDISKVVLESKNLIRTPAEISKLVKDYIDNHASYSSSIMSKDLNISVSTALKYIKIHDPNGIKKVRANAVKKNSSHTRKKRTSLSKEDIQLKIKNYLESHEYYNMNNMAKELELSWTTLFRYIPMYDPGFTRRVSSPKSSKTKSKIQEKRTSIFDFMKLSDDDLQRKSWLDSAIVEYSRAKHISKKKILTPIYETLNRVYGVVFDQKGMDYLYDHKYTPIEDYPLPTKYELIVLDEDLFKTSRALLVDKYGEL